METFDPKLFRTVMGQFATGVTVVTYLCERQPAGMTANAFMSVSMDPPLILVSVRRVSRFTAHVKSGSRYGVSFLNESQHHLSAHFGGMPVEGMDVQYAHVGDTPLIEGSLAQIVARTIDVHAAGDHLLYIGQIEALRVGETHKPLIFYGGKYKHIKAREQEFVWHTGDGW